MGPLMAPFFLTTITFFGERKDIFGPRCLVSGTRPNAGILSVGPWLTTCRMTPTRSPAVTNCALPGNGPIRTPRSVAYDRSHSGLRRAPGKADLSRRPLNLCASQIDGWAFIRLSVTCPSVA